MKKFVAVALLSALTFMPVLANDFGFGINFTKNDDVLLIQDVIPNSLAEKSGLKAGQKVLKFNGKAINKLKADSLTNIDNYKSLKLITDNNKQYSLKQEDITLLKSYNQVNDTFSDKTKYNVANYITEKIILPNSIDSKHVKYSNAYLNYADAISTDNSKIYVELFKVTDDNVKSALEEVKNNSINEYASLYNEIYRNNKSSDIYGKAFKQFLELAIYNDVNKELIDRQISEFNSAQKKQYSQMVYNTKIVANLYSYSNRELGIYLIKHTVNANSKDKWENELKTENNIYNVKYKELCNSLSKNKIEITKPGPLSNREQVTAGTPPKDKWVEDKQIVVLAQAKGYNPNDNAEVKKINNAKIVAQKQKAEQEAAKKAEENMKKAQANISTVQPKSNSTTQKSKYANVKRTRAYPKYFYDAAKDCESQIKIGFPINAPFICLANNLRNPIYYFNNFGYVNGTLPFFYAAMLDEKYAGQEDTKEVRQIMQTVVPISLMQIGNAISQGGTIDQRAYNMIMYGTGIK